MYKIFAILAIATTLLSSCNWAKEKAKDTLHKGGEIVGKAGTEVADGISEGVEQSLANSVELSPALAADGLSVGRVKISGTYQTTDNIISVYFIFDKKYSGKLTAKVFGKDSKEFGRVATEVSGEQGEAKYYDFTFDERVNIDRNDKIVIGK